MARAMPTIIPLLFILGVNLEARQAVPREPLPKLAVHALPLPEQGPLAPHGQFRLLVKFQNQLRVREIRYSNVVCLARHQSLSLPCASASAAGWASAPSRVRSCPACFLSQDDSQKFTLCASSSSWAARLAPRQPR